MTGLEVLTDLCAGGPDPDSLNSITVRGMASGAMHIKFLAPSRDAITAWEQHLGLVQGSELLLSSGRLHVTRWARIARGGRPVNVHLSGTVQQ